MVRILPALAVLLFAVALTWYLARRTATPQPPLAAPTPTVAFSPPPPAPDQEDAESPAPHGTHRLAGTVVGDLLYAIIEAPDGTNGLYVIDEFVPDLGKLVAIGEKSATFEGRNGRFDLKLLAAPAPTAAPTAADPGLDDPAEYGDEEDLDLLDEDEFGEKIVDAAPSDDSTSNRRE